MHSIKNFSGNTSMKLFASMAALVFPLLAAACGTDQIAISVSAETRNAIADAVPPADYSFLVSADYAPDNLADLTERDLLVCGILERRDLLKLMTAQKSEGTLMFRSLKHIYLDPLQDSAVTNESEEMTVLFPGAGEASLPVERVVHGGDAGGDSLLASCMENMDDRDVFLLDEDLGVSAPEALVSLVFR